MNSKLKFFMMVLISLIIVVGCSDPESADVEPGNIEEEPESPESETEEAISVLVTYPHYDDAKELTDEADFVFTGKVSGVNSEMIDIRSDDGPLTITLTAGGMTIPYTIYDVEIDELLKGYWNEPGIQIKRIAGVYEDKKYDVVDAPEIELGESYLFIVNNFDDYPSLVNFEQSVYHLSDSEDRDGITSDEILAVFD